MKMRYKLLCSWSLFFLGGLCLGSYVMADDETLVSIKFKGLSMPEQVDDIYYNVGDIRCPVKLTTSVFSREYTYRGRTPMTFLRDIPDAEGIMRPVAIAKAHIPQGASEVSMLFLPSPGEKGKYHVRVYADDENDFSWGAYRFVNLTQERIAVALGQERNLVLSGRTTVIPMTEETRSTSISVKLAAEDNRDEWKLVFSTNWAVNPNVRYLVLIYQDKDKGYKVKRIREVFKDT